MYKKHFVCNLVVGLCFATLSPNSEAVQNLRFNDHISAWGGLAVIHAWMPAPQRGESLIYLTIRNRSSTPAVLRSMMAEFADSMQLVGFQYVDGQVRYVPVEPFPIESGATLILEPYGLAVSVTGVSKSFVSGDVVDMEIKFARGTFPVRVTVEPADATTHRNAGHTH